jgi:hypothetical protein
MKNILFILAISSIYCGVFAQKNFIPNPSFENQPIDRDVHDNIESDDNDLIAAREARVMLTNSPDYVFEDDYCLDELENVAEFIKTNEHLLGVISAKEVEENGGFEISIPFKSEDIDRIQVINQTGQIVFEKTSNTGTEINIPNPISGLYFVSIISKSKVFTQK